MSLPDRYRNAAGFVLVALLFGVGFPAIKTGLRELPPLLFAGLRFDVAALFLLGYVLVARSRDAVVPRTRGDSAALAVATVFVVVLNNGFLFLGQVSTTPAAASVMYGLSPVLAPLFAWWLLRERLSWLGAAGIGVALGGVVLIVRPSPATLADASSVGQMLVLGAAAAVAFGSVLLRRIDPRMASLPLTAWAMAAGAVGLHLSSVALGEPQAPATTIGPATAVALLTVGLLSTALAYPVYFGLIDGIGPVRTNLLAYLVPVFATLFGWLALGATVSRFTVAGFAVVVAGFGLVERETVGAELGRLWQYLGRRLSSGRLAPETED